LFVIGERGPYVVPTFFFGGRPPETKTGPCFNRIFGRFSCWGVKKQQKISKKSPKQYIGLAALLR
jgi:hypothetical protein